MFQLVFFFDLQKSVVARYFYENSTWSPVREMNRLQCLSLLTCIDAKTLRLVPLPNTRSRAVGLVSHNRPRQQEFSRGSSLGLK